MTEAERAARSDAAYKDMRKQLDDALKKDTRLAKIAEKIKAGKANFTDTAEYSDLVAKHLSGVIKNNIGTIKSSAGIRMVCDALLKDHYESINDVLGQVQTVLDEQNGIHLRPQAAAYPAERVHTLTSSLTDPTVAAQTILRRAGAPVENVAKSMHDDYMEENAKFRSDAGLKCWIVRTTDGKCCSWCTSIAGRYEYGKEPHSVYRRHDNCGCTVTYENGRQRQDVWSKRTWESDQPTPARVEPTRLTGAQGRETEQRNLSQITRFSHAQGEAVQGQNLRYRGLTSGAGSGIIKAEGYPEEHLNRKASLLTVEEDLKATNPNYKSDKRYQGNCQRCVPTYLLRRRGYNVEALPIGDNPDMDELLGNNPTIIWKKSGNPLIPKTTRGSTYFGKPEIETFMKDLPDGAMCEIRFAWADGGGHVFVAEKINGKVHYIDPQTGDADASRYFKKMKADQTTFVRIDDATIDDEMIKHCCKNK